MVAVVAIAMAMPILISWSGVRSGVIDEGDVRDDGGRGRR